nr:hypothetical protein [Tanacetum cinerariifolium]
GEAAPKPKASARRKKGGSASSTTPPTLIATPTPITTVMATPRLTTDAKGKQPARATSPADPSDVEEISKIDEQKATESGEGDDKETKSDGEVRKKKQRKRKRRVLIQFQELLKKVRMMAMVRRIKDLLNPIIDPGMESIFTTGSSSVTPIPSPKSTMTPSIMTTTTTASQPPIPLTPIPSDILQTLLTFASVFRFEDRVKSLEVKFSKFMRTNQSS